MVFCRPHINLIKGSVYEENIFGYYVVWDDNLSN